MTNTQNNPGAGVKERLQSKLKLSVGKKIAIGYIFATLFSMLIGGLGFYSNLHTDNMLHYMADELFGITKQINDLNYQRTMIYAFIYESLSSQQSLNGRKNIHRIKSQAIEVLERCNVLWNRLNANKAVNKNLRDYKELALAYGNWKAKYVPSFIAYLDLLDHTTDENEAAKIYENLAEHINYNQVYSYQFYCTLIAFLNKTSVKVDALIEENHEVTQGLLIITGLIIILGIGVFIILACFIVNAISKPIKQSFINLKAIIDGNTAVHFDVVSHDEIGEMAELVEKLNAMRKKAEESTLAKSQFLASMSHEIRTPMNAIIGMIELMPSENLNELQADYFGSISRTARSLLGIINDILDFSKIEAGKMTLVPENYDFHTAFKNTASIGKFLAAEKNLEFRSYISEDVPQVLFGDDVRVRQVMTNVISNAVKYTRQGYVEFNAYIKEINSKKYVCLEVKDSGIGIKQEDMKKLFGSFEQFDAQKNRGVTGTGLGLAITKRLVDLMKGSIEVQSEYEKGSCFTLNLPLVSAAADKTGIIISVEYAKAKAGLRVLVVDDVQLNLTVARGFLAKHNIHADTASLAKEAIAKIQDMYKNNTPYDLVFMDHMMPEIDGIEAVKMIRDLPDESGKGDDSYYKKLIVIAFSANAVNDAQELFLSSGMNDFISKPIEDAALNRMLLKWLPPDKLEKTEAPESGQAPSGEAAPELDSNVDFNIPGIDTKTGLVNTGGDIAAFKAVLNQFCVSFDGTLDALDGDFNNSNWKDYGIRAHGIKSVLRTIGAMELGETAYKLELAGKGGDAQTCTSLHKGFKESLISLKNSIAGALPEGTAESGAGDSETELSAAGGISGILAELAKACAGGMVEEIDGLAALLKKAAPRDGGEEERIKKILALIENFDYEEAAAIASTGL